LAIVGAGKMTRLLVTHLAAHGLERITIVNRSVGRVHELQEQFPDVQIECKLMDDLWDVIGRSDIVYTATASEDYIIDAQKMEENGLFGGKPLMIVDISVPRNVADNCKDVSINCGEALTFGIKAHVTFDIVVQIPNVHAYNVDDLKAVVAKNTAMRQREMLEAENLLREETKAFCAWREALSAIPTINQLQERANAVRQEELKKCTRKLSNANLSDKELEAVERLSRGIVNKLLHGPMAHLHKTESIEGKQATLKELSAMFRLEDADNNNVNGNKRRK
jgi:glutamyl-tRNA reductase